MALGLRKLIKNNNWTQVIFLWCWAKKALDKMEHRCGMVKKHDVIPRHEIFMSHGVKIWYSTK